MKIVITRLEEKKDDTHALFEEYGHEAIIIHTMTAAPPDDLGPLKLLAEKTQKGEVDYLLFTSSLTVNKFFEHCTFIPPGTSVLCVGPKTAQALQQHGYGCKTLETYNADYFAGQLREEAHGKTIGIPRADISNPLLIEGLEGLGAIVIEAPAYKLLPVVHPQNSRKVREADAILFTSGKSYQYANFSTGELEDRIIMAIGPKTRQTLLAGGITPDITGKGTIESCLEQLNHQQSTQKEKTNN